MTFWNVCCDVTSHLLVVGGGILAARYQQLFYVFEYILNEPESLDTQQHFSL